MQKIKLTDLNEAVRSFLDESLKDGGVVVENEAGQACAGIIPYVEATPEEKRQAWQRIEEIQQNVARSMQQQGVTEEDVDRLLAEND